MSFMTWFIYALALAPNSAGQPAGKNERIRRDIPHDLDIIVYDAEVTSATRVREAVEWVDEAGKLVGIATEDVLLLPTSLAPRALLNETEAKDVTTPQCTKTLLLPPNRGPSSENRHDRISAPARLNELMTASNTASSGTTEATEHTETPSASSDGKKAASRRFGVSYTPYRADQGCKSQNDIDNDFKRMAGSYSVIRIYGTDCNQVSMVYSAAKAHGIKLFLGIWNPSSLQEEANKIIAAVDGDWDVVDTVSIGNELVNNGKASPPELMSFVSQARSVLRAAGYDGPVVAVDTFTAVLAHPKLCDESDYCAINAHAFFDGSVLPSQSGRWLHNIISGVRSAISDRKKKIVVTETGWPTKGASNGVAVPSLENQKIALQSIEEQFRGSPESIILFSAFNDLWKKKEMETFNADQFWGIEGAISACDE